MKRILNLTFALLLLLFGGNSVAQKAVIDCQFVGLDVGTTLVLNEVVGVRMQPLAQLTVGEGGKVHIEQAVDDLMFAVITLPDVQQAMLHMFLSKGMRLSMKVQYHKEIALFEVLETKGSKDMEVYSQYTHLAYQALTTNDFDILNNNLAPLLAKNPDVLMSAFLITYYDDFFNRHIATYKAIYDALKGRYADNVFVSNIESRLNSAILIGQQAPDIALPDINGNIRHLSDLRGKVVLIDFWASWCRPCRMENPNVVRLYNKYHSKGFDIFSVSLDNNRQQWLSAIANDNLIWENHVSDLRGWSSEGARLYGIKSIPSTILIDASGNVLARDLRGSAIEQTLEKIFSK